MERGVSRGKREVCPSEQARESRFPSLFRGVRRGFPSGKLGRSLSARLVWRSRMPNPGKISPEGAV